MQPLNYDELAAHIRAQGGITLDIGSGDEPTEGYAVALAGHEERHAAAGLLPLQDQTYSYIVHHGRALCDPGAHLGVWYSGGDWVFDVVHVYDTLADAEVMATANRQESFYSLHNEETIWCVTH